MRLWYCQADQLDHSCNDAANMGQQARNYGNISGRHLVSAAPRVSWCPTTPSFVILRYRVDLINNFIVAAVPGGFRIGARVVLL
jgi:hypothetical protein